VVSAQQSFTQCFTAPAAIVAGRVGRAETGHIEGIGRRSCADCDKGGGEEGISDSEENKGSITRGPDVNKSRRLNAHRNQ